MPISGPSATATAAPRLRPIAALIIALFALFGTWNPGSTAHAQGYPAASCNEADWPPPPPGTEPDLHQCCYAFSDCYERNSCSVGTDWPEAFSRQCLGCNLTALGCMGMALTGVTPDWECPARCDYEGASCGSPDGCGGVCVSDELCPFLAMHPEFSVVLFP